MPSCMPVGGTQPPCTPASLYHLVHPLMEQVLMTVLVRRLKRQGYAGGKRLFLLLRINPSQPGNLSKRAKKPGTESTLAQGPPFYPNPSKSDLKPPSRLEQALSVPINEARSPLPGPWFLIKVDKSVQNGHIGHPILQHSQHSVLLSKPPVLTKPLNSLTILVSFGGF